MRGSGTDGAGDEAGDFGDDFGGDDELTAMMAGLDQSDPRSLARVARRMAAESGEAIEPELDTALTRIERGEDPDRVLADFDESDISGMDDGGLDDDGMIYS